MGNEKSQPTGLVIEENAIEVTDRWSLHSSTHLATGIPKICVYVCASQAQSTPTLLEKFAKNLMVHRHPCILKYVATWQKNGKFHLATEEVRPLVQVLPSQTALQVCIGLQSVLTALNFLHEMAQSSHNNVCRAAVYVTPDGTWKLGGLEYLCRFSELSSGYLGGARMGRYEAGLSPGEEERVPQPPSAVDRFAFGVLAEEVLSAYKSLDEVPGMAEFRELCKTQLQNASPAVRPSLSKVLQLPFFTHDFINIHNFLIELTLKSEPDKQEFFRDLSGKLSLFPEEVVASQLSSLLLSRVVLLDSTAQQHLLPQIFVPRKDDDICKGRLFSEKTFKTYLVPKLLSMFCVRDAHVRLILLTHFSSFCTMFSPAQLKIQILPELLVGIKDTNDVLVSFTLRALADIVPILGSSVVIGGKTRMKLFADGRPKAVRPSSKRSNHCKSPKQLDADPGSVVLPNEPVLPERASPDGGEEPTSHTASEEETENWIGWGENTVSEDLSESKAESVTSGLAHQESSAASLPDITTLDIKSNTACAAHSASNEIDYFQDMEPVISTNHIVSLDTEPSKPSISKFEIAQVESDSIAGWGDDDNWDDIENGDASEKSKT